MPLGCEFIGFFKSINHIQVESEKFLEDTFQDIGKFLVFIDPNLAIVQIQIDTTELSGPTQQLFLEGLDQEKEAIRLKMVEESRKIFQSASDVFKFVAKHKSAILEIMYQNSIIKDIIIERLIQLKSDLETEEKSFSFFESLCFMATHSGKNKIDWATKLINEIVSKYESGSTAFDNLKIQRIETLFQKHHKLLHHEVMEINHTLTKAAYEFWTQIDHNGAGNLENSTLEKCLIASFNGWQRINVKRSSKKKNSIPVWKPDAIKVLRLRHLLSFILMPERCFKSAERCIYFREFCMKTIFKNLKKFEIDQFLINYIAYFEVFRNNKKQFLKDIDLFLRCIPLETYFKDYQSWYWSWSIGFEDSLFLSALYFLESLKIKNSQAMFVAIEALEIARDSIDCLMANRSGTAEKILKKRLTPKEFNLIKENYNLTPEKDHILHTIPQEYFSIDSEDLIGFSNILRDELLNYRLNKLQGRSSEKIKNKSSDQLTLNIISQSILKRLTDFFKEQQINSIALKRSLIQTHFNLTKEEKRILFLIIFENISDVELYDLTEQRDVLDTAWSLPTEAITPLRWEIEQQPVIPEFLPVPLNISSETSQKVV